MSSRTDVVFFDFFETIGSEVARSPDQRLEDFEVYASVRPFLVRLAERARLGVLSLDPDVDPNRLGRLLEAKDLVPPLDPDLIAGVRRREDDPFGRLLAQVGLSESDHPVFVSLDSRRRTRAAARGFRVVPHPDLVSAVLDGESLRYVRLSGRGHEEPDWKSVVDTLTVVPVHRTREPDAATREPTAALYAIASGQALAKLAEPPFLDTVEVERLADSDVVALTTLVALQITPEQVSASSDLGAFVTHLEGVMPFVRRTPRGLLIALPGERSADDLHPPPAGAGHGHTRALLPEPGLVPAARRQEAIATHAPPVEEGPGFEALDGEAFGRALESLIGTQPR